MADERVNTFADRLFEAGVRFPDSTRAVIVFKEYLAATDPIPPTDDEREVLADVWAVEHGGSARPDRHVRVGYPLADAILAAGFHRQGPITEDECEALAQAEAERRWPIHPHGVTDTRDVPELLRHRACFVQGAVWAAGIAAREVENG